MRTKRIYANIKNSQKIRVILNGVGVYTTVMQAQGIFSHTYHRVAVDVALTEIAQQRGKILGYATRWNGIDVQVDLL